MRRRVFEVLPAVAGMTSAAGSAVAAQEEAPTLTTGDKATPWLTLGADLQLIKPSMADETAVFAVLRTVIRF